MASLHADFPAGRINWYRFGPSRHAARKYERVKISVLLGDTGTRWRPAAHSAWRAGSAGSFSLFLSGTSHEMEFTGAGELFSLELEKELLGKKWAAASEEEAVAYDVRNARDRFLFHVGTEAAELLRRQGTLSAKYVESVATVVSAHLRDRYLQRSLVRRAPTLAPWVEQRVLTHIQENVGSPLPIAHLAEVAGMSPFHFARAFRGSIGETPHQFVVRQRLEQAQRILLAGPGAPSLAEAALLAGFSSQSHLTTRFREFFGVTPREFLRKERSFRARS